MKDLLIIISLLLLLSCNKNSTSPDLCLDQDYDNDDICDSEDDCIGEYDCIGVCNGTSIWCLDDDGYLDNLHDFQFNGSITSQILIEDISIVDQGDILAAFVDDDLRGVAIPTEVPFGPHAGTYQFLLLVYSNTAAGETIDFQFYDSDLDIVYNIVRTVNNIIQTTNFTTDMILGDVISPEIFNIVN